MLRLIRKIIKTQAFKLIATFAVISGIVAFISYRYGIVQKAMGYFTIHNIAVSETKIISQEETLKAAGIAIGDYTFNTSCEEVRANLEKIDWVKKSIVCRTLPSKYEIFIEERIPIAYWQTKDALLFIDQDGKVLPTHSIKDLHSMPIATGEGAPSAMPAFLAVLKQYPLIAQQVVFCHYIGNRRWDIQINRGLIIKLPESDIEKALKLLLRLGSKDGYFADDISVIDLRIPERIILRRRT